MCTSEHGFDKCKLCNMYLLTNISERNNIVQRKYLFDNFTNPNGGFFVTKINPEQKQRKYFQNV